MSVESLLIHASTPHMTLIIVIRKVPCIFMLLFIIVCKPQLLIFINQTVGESHF